MGAQWKTAGKIATAAAKGRVFSKLAKEIALAARSGADPAGNPRLRALIESAKKVSMTRDTLERAIKKGAGLLDEPLHYELVTFEGFAPHRVPVIVECLTDNRNRTAPDMRSLFRDGLFGSKVLFLSRGVSSSKEPCVPLRVFEVLPLRLFLSDSSASM